MTDVRLHREHVEALVKLNPSRQLHRVHAEVLMGTNRTVYGGRATETDAAQAGISNDGVLRIDSGRATETDVARAATLSVTVISGRATETDQIRKSIPAVELSADLRIAATKVGADLSDFVVRVPIALLPEQWFEGEQFNGGNLRAFVLSGGGTIETRVPADVVYYDSANHKGDLFLKVDLSSTVATDLRITLGTGWDPTDVDDPYGQHAVWSDYAFICFWVDAIDRSPGMHDIDTAGVLVGYYNDTLVISSSIFHQGVAWTGSGWIGTGGNANQTIARFGDDGSLLDSHGSASTLWGIPFNHLSGCCYKDGEVFVSTENYPGDDGQYIVVLDPADLTTPKRIYDLNAQSFANSDIAWNPTLGRFIAISSGPASIHTYDEDWNYIEELTPPDLILDCQGIEYSGGNYYLLSGPIGGSSAIYRVPDDLLATELMWTGAIHRQGICVKDQSAVHPDIYGGSSGGSLVEYVYSDPGVVPDPNYLQLIGSGNAIARLLPKYTQWTMGASIILGADPGSANRAVLSYSAYSTLSSARATLYAAGGSHDRWSIYNASDGHIYGSPWELDVRHRLHHVQDATTQRSLYLDGVLNATTTPATQRPTNGSDGTMALYIGAEDNDFNERITGKITAVYLRNGVLSPEWLAAEQASWEHDDFVIPTITIIGKQVEEAETARAGNTITGVAPITVLSGKAVETERTQVSINPDDQLGGTIRKLGADQFYTFDAHPVSDMIEPDVSGNGYDLYGGGSTPVAASSLQVDHFGSARTFDGDSGLFNLGPTGVGGGYPPVSTGQPYIPMSDYLSVFFVYRPTQVNSIVFQRGAVRIDVRETGWRATITTTTTPDDGDHGTGYEGLTIQTTFEEWNWEIPLQICRILLTFDGDRVRLWNDQTLLLEATTTTGSVLDWLARGEVTDFDYSPTGVMAFPVYTPAEMDDPTGIAGTIDTLAVWHRALTDEEVEELLASATTYPIEPHRIEEADEAFPGIVTVEAPEDGAIFAVRAEETDEAFGGILSVAIVSGRATETDEAEPGLTGTFVVAGRALESDLAEPGSVEIIYLAGLIIEVDEAQAGSVDARGLIITGGKAVELDTVSAGFVPLPAHPADTIRWIFHDPTTDESWTMPINPNSMTPIIQRRDLQHSGSIYGTLSMQTGRREEQFDFTGVIRSQAHYDELVEWASKRYAIEVTDHTGRMFRIYITDFEATDRPPIPRTPARWTYTMKSKLLAGPL